MNEAFYGIAPSSVAKLRSLFDSTPDLSKVWIFGSRAVGTARIESDIDLAVQALKRGAFDFITKPWDNVRLIATCHEALQRAQPAAEGAPPPQPAAEPVRSLAAQERAAVLAAMAQAEGNLSAAARALGLSRAALYRRLDKHGL